MRTGTSRLFILWRVKVAGPLEMWLRQVVPSKQKAGVLIGEEEWWRALSFLTLFTCFSILGRPLS